MKDVLLIDDNDAWKDVLKDILNQFSDEHINIISIKDGREGLDKYIEMKNSLREPKLTLVDQRLILIDGDRVIKDIKTKFPSANICGFTMYTEDKKANQRMVQSGARRVIPKSPHARRLAMDILEMM